MKIVRTRKFKKCYKELPANIKKIAEDKFKKFIENARHPSLRVRKMEGTKDIWEGSITMVYRFTFEIHGDKYILRVIGKHKETLKNP